MSFSYYFGIVIVAIMFASLIIFVLALIGLPVSAVFAGNLFGFALTLACIDFLAKKIYGKKEKPKSKSKR